MGVLRARLQVGFNVKNFFYVTLGCYFLFINVIIGMFMHAYVYFVNRVDFACLAGKPTSSSHKSQSKGVQWFSDSSKPTGSDRPKSQQVNPKPIMSRIRVCFFQNPIIQVR